MVQGAVEVQGVAVGQEGPPTRGAAQRPWRVAGLEAAAREAAEAMEVAVTEAAAPCVAAVRPQAAVAKGVAAWTAAAASSVALAEAGPPLVRLAQACSSPLLLYRRPHRRPRRRRHR